MERRYDWNFKGNSLVVDTKKGRIHKLLRVMENRNLFTRYGKLIIKLFRYNSYTYHDIIEHSRRYCLMVSDPSNLLFLSKRVPRTPSFRL